MPCLCHIVTSCCGSRTGQQRGYNSVACRDTGSADQRAGRLLAADQSGLDCRILSRTSIPRCVHAGVPWRQLCWLELLKFNLSLAKQSVSQPSSGCHPRCRPAGMTCNPFKPIANYILHKLWMGRSLHMVLGMCRFSCKNYVNTPATLEPQPHLVLGCFSLTHNRHSGESQQLGNMLEYYFGWTGCLY